MFQGVFTIGAYVAIFMMPVYYNFRRRISETSEESGLRKRCLGEYEMKLKIA